MSGLNNGHIHEFPYIRIDSFSQSPTPNFPSAQLYLLTHAHTDHLTGLDSASTNIIILCSEVTKRLVLNYEREKDRVAFDRGVIERRRKAYQGLAAFSERQAGVGACTGQKRSVSGAGVVRDPFRVLRFDTPERFDVGYDPKTGRTRSVVITMLDANHCPGSAMFLLMDPDTGTTILHTGDVRPDRPFLDRLERHPAVMSYLAKIMGMDTVQRGNEADIVASGMFRTQRLERVYLDTSAVIGTCDMPSKEEAVRGLIQTLQMYPSDTIFYLHTWCTGYEDALKAIAMIFGTTIHVDRWRYLNYRNTVDDPVLQTLCTTDESASRFHTCERRNQCGALQAAFEPGSGKRVVTVDFVEEKAVEHAVKMQQVRKECLEAIQGNGEWPRKLYCPLARHATLPELQALLDLFRPKSLAPNTLLPSLKGADYYAMIAAFGDCLAPGGKEELRANCLAWFKREKGLKTEQEVCAFARQTLLFQAAPTGAESALDLRTGRSANRQRQSEVFLPSLPFATKNTVNSPNAHSIPEAPTIVVSPGTVALRESFGRIDMGSRDDHSLDDEETQEEDTQLEKSRETRRLVRAKPAVAPLASSGGHTDEETQEMAIREPDFIVYAACSHGERLLKNLPTTSTLRSTKSCDKPVDKFPAGNVTVSTDVSVSATSNFASADSSSARCPRTSSGSNRPSAKKNRNMRDSLRMSFDDIGRRKSVRR